MEKGKKCCSNCKILEKIKNNTIMQPISFTCPVLNELIMIPITKVLVIKMEKLQEFYCGYFTSN